MPPLREIFAEYDIDFDRRRDLARGNRRVTQLRNVLRRLTPTVTSAAAALGAMATAAGVGAATGLQRIVSSTVESTRTIERWAGRLSISSDALRSWTELAREYGADIDDVTDGLKELQLKGQDALSGGTAQAEIFERIGISLDDLRPIINDTDALMSLFVTKLSQVNDVALRNFTVDELMSDSGTRLNEVFALGNEEIQRRRAAITQQLGPLANLSRAVAEHTQLVLAATRRWERFKREITVAVLPVVRDLLRKFAEFEEPLRRVVGQIGQFIEKSHILQGVLVGLGVVAVGVAAATVTAWAPVVAAFVGLLLVVAGVAVAFDQVKRAVTGGESALKDFLEHEDRLGEGGVTGVVLLLGDAWERLTGRIEYATNAVTEFMSEIQPVVDTLRFIWDLISFMSGGFVMEALGMEPLLGQAMPALRDAAQGRLEEERSRQNRQIRESTRGRVGEETVDSWSGEVSDLSGQPVSVDMSEIEVLQTGGTDVADLSSGTITTGDGSPRPAPVDRSAIEVLQTGGVDVADLSSGIIRRSAEQTPLPRMALPELSRAAESVRQQAQNLNISSPTTMNFTISEATDSEEITRLVTREIETSQRRLTSEIESMISDQTEVGS